MLNIEQMRKQTLLVSPDVYLDIQNPNTLELNNSFKSKITIEHGEEVRYKRDTSCQLNVLERIITRMYSSNEYVQAMIASSGVAIATLISLSRKFKNIYYLDNTYPEMIEAYSQLGNAKVLKTIGQLQEGDILCVESISVPMCSSNHELIESSVQMIHDRGAFILVDTTCETGYNYNPIAFGVDFVIESLSKIVTGFNTSILGALVVNDRQEAKDAFQTIKELRRYYGFYPHPIDVQLCLLGVQTFGLRLDRVMKTSSSIYAFLIKNSISFKCILRSGLFYIDVDQDLDISELKGLSVIQIADTFGSNFTVMTRWREPDVLRVSIGIEDQDDLIDAFKNLIQNKKIKRI